MYEKLLFRALIRSSTRTSQRYLLIWSVLSKCIRCRQKFCCNYREISPLQRIRNKKSARIHSSTGYMNSPECKNPFSLTRQPAPDCINVVTGNFAYIRVCVCVCVRCSALSRNVLKCTDLLLFPQTNRRSRCFSTLICRRREEDLPLRGKSRRKRQTDGEKMRDRGIKPWLHRDASWPFSRPLQMSLNRRSWRIRARNGPWGR